MVTNLRVLKFGQFLEWLSSWWLFKNDSAPWTEGGSYIFIILVPDITAIIPEKIPHY
jgi:hypothetical protein